MLRFPYLLSVYTNLKLQKSSKVLNCSGCISTLCSIIVCLGSLFKNALNQLGDDFNDVIPPVNIYWKVGR